MGPGSAYLLVYKPIVLDFLVLDLNLYRTRQNGLDLPFEEVLLHPGQGAVPGWTKAQMADPQRTAVEAFRDVTAIDLSDTADRRSMLCLGPLARSWPESDPEPPGWWNLQEKVQVWYFYQAVADAGLVARTTNDRIAAPAGSKRPAFNDVHSARVLNRQAAVDACGPPGPDAFTTGWRGEQFAALPGHKQQDVLDYDHKYRGLNFRAPMRQLIATMG